ncbi:uncharacterized protein LOC143568617 [Bidens hawaiensis]|uniref:uncharacterized protein LOC143568617 n=1 Tax=Bidens hawaiensis TaxID=980011 RepID=UPI004049A71F
MAAWRMQRRLFSLFANTTRQPNISLRNDSSQYILPSLNSFLHGEQFQKTQSRTLSKTSNMTAETAIKHEASSSNSVENTVTMNHPAINDNNEFAFTAKSGLKVSPRHDLAMLFTCKVCDTRSVKTISRECYEKGVVVARCGGCNNHHLIADHLGMFGDKCSIEDILAARGEEVKKGNSDTLNLTLEDLVGMIKS